MHNLYAIFVKYLNICKQMAGDLVNEHGNSLVPLSTETLLTNKLRLAKLKSFIIV